MGTYTTNKNLFMPSVGETGWGELVNGNFETIDNFLKPITVSGNTYTFTGNHVGNQSGGSISATSITNSGTLTSTGKITANGGIAGTTGTFSGEVTCASFKPTNTRVVTVTSSSSIFSPPYTSWTGHFTYDALPLIEGVVYTGSLTVYGNVSTNANTLRVCGINEDNTFNAFNYGGYGATTNISFTRIKALYIDKRITSAQTKNICAIPILS